MLAATPFQHIERGQGQLALDTLAKVMPLYEKVKIFAKRKSVTLILSSFTAVRYRVSTC